VVSKARHNPEPTTEELVTAHHLRNNQDHLDFIGIYEERYEECLQAAMKYDDEDEDIDGKDADKHNEDETNDDELKDEIVEKQVIEEEYNADLPDVGIPLPDLEFDYDLPAPDTLST
jgi:hypothetical protein